MSDLNGKFALVTGAQRGIGAAIARRLARDGARVWINAVEELDRAQTLAAQLDGELVEADVSHPEQVTRMLERTGPLDVVVNNAADQTRQPVLEVDHKTWNRTLAVNLTGPLLVTRGAARSMPAGGAIVNVASIHAFIALRRAAAYTASKAALAMLTRQAALELGEQGIRVNAVAPGDDRRPGTGAPAAAGWPSALSTPPAATRGRSRGGRVGSRIFSLRRCVLRHGRSVDRGWWAADSASAVVNPAAKRSDLRAASDRRPGQLLSKEEGQEELRVPRPGARDSTMIPLACGATAGHLARLDFGGRTASGRDSEIQ